MKRVIAWLLVLALTATVSIGATLAYLTDTDEDVNVMTLGKVKIDQLEYERIDDETQNEDAKVQEFHDNKPLYPAVIGTGFDYPPVTAILTGSRSARMVIPPKSGIPPRSTTKWTRWCS